MSVLKALEQTKRPTQMSLLGEPTPASPPVEPPPPTPPPPTPPPPIPDFTTSFPKLPQHIDPRPDITHDAVNWRALLTIAWRMAWQKRIPDSVYGLLHGLRCGGASLQIFPDRSIKIRRGEWSAEDYAEVRDGWLVPNQEHVVAVLNEFTKLLRE